MSSQAEHSERMIQTLKARNAKLETDEQFVEKVRWWIYSGAGSLEDKDRLFTLVNRGAASQWRPISEAPKDGTPLLLLWPDAAEKMAVMWWDEYGEGWQGYYDGTNPGLQPPTHWMPLPPPPAGEPSDETADRISLLEAMLREVMEQCPEHVPRGLKNQIRTALGEERT